MNTTRRAEAYWIEKRGYWQINVQHNGVRKGFTSKLPGRKGKHAAEAKADAWLCAGGSDTLRFRDAWALYVKHKEKLVAQATLKQLDHFGQAYLMPQLRLVRIDSLHPSHWQSCIDAAAAAGLSHGTLSYHITNIMMFLKFCKLQRWAVDEVDRSELSIPVSAPAPKEKHALGEDDLRKLFESDLNDKGKIPFFLYAWRFIVLTGFRRGEMCGLRKEDITDETITIRRSISNANGITPGKTKNAQRVIAITPSVRKVLSDQAAFLESMHIDSPWVFPSRSGDHADPSYVSHMWRQFGKEHSFTCSTIHELRHTFISINKSDLPLPLLKQLVGHSDTTDTIGIYGHEIDSDRSRAAQIIEENFEKIIGLQKK